MDKFIIRISIIIFSLFIGISLCFAWNGILISEYDSLFSCSFMSGLILNVLVFSQGKYHCAYMRGLASNLIITPLINFTDSYFLIFEDAYIYVLVLSIIWIFSFITTLFLAIHHFTKVNKIKKAHNEFRRRNERKD